MKSKVSNIPGKVSTKVNENERMYANSNTDIANNEYFVSIFSSYSDIASENRDCLHNIEFESITLLEEQVLAVILNLDQNKAHGPDNIPACLLKETAVQIAPSLCSLFTKSLRIGVVPDDWKLANVVPVYKHGEKAEVENYRHISLLSLISKPSDVVYLITSNIMLTNG